MRDDWFWRRNRFDDRLGTDWIWLWYWLFDRGDDFDLLDDERSRRFYRQRRKTINNCNGIGIGIGSGLFMIIRR